MSRYPVFVQFERPAVRHLPEQPALVDLLPFINIPHLSHGHGDSLGDLQSARDITAIKEDKDKFQFNLDIQHFSPEEVTVKTVDGFVVVDAQHEERADDHGFVTRSFTRRCALPEGVDPDSVTSKLSSDGVLTISAPLKRPKSSSNERVVPIIHTGPVKKQV